MAKMVATAEKLMTAINIQYGTHLVLNRLRFFGSEGSPVTMYIVKDAYKDSDGKFQDNVLFRTTSSIYLCLYMRDFYFYMQGKDIEGDTNAGWEEVKKKKSPIGSYKLIKEKYCAD